MFENDLIELNKYDSEKYKKLDRDLITKSVKKNITKKYLWIKVKELEPHQLWDHAEHRKSRKWWMK